MNREERRPTAVERAAAVLFVRIENAVAIEVVAVEELRRDALDQKQFVDAVEGAVAGRL